MEPRERVVTALEHKEPDRIPRDLGSSLVTGIHKDAYERYMEYQVGGTKLSNIQIIDIIQQLARVNEDVLKEWRIDTRGVWARPPSNWKLNVKETKSHYTFIDQWGIKWGKPKKKGLYFDMQDHPLSGKIMKKYIEGYPWPLPDDKARVKGLRDEIKQIKEDHDYFIFMTGLGPGIYELCQWMRGYKDFWIDLGKGADLAHFLLDKITELKVKFWEMALEEVGDLIDTVYIADDLGTQSKLQISIDMYKEFILPYHKRLFNFIKDNASSRVYIFFHSDGAIKDLLPFLLEAGIDILNPVQVSADGMEPGDLKAEFGDELSFWGAGANPHGTLGKNQPDKVKEELRDRIKELSPRGGWIFAPIHNIQPDVSPENVQAIWDTLDKYGNY